MTLSINQLRKTYGDKVAVNDISLHLPKGEVLGLLGRNGAGKTTTIKMLLGLVEPTSGTIEWNGNPFDRSELSIGYLPEERGLYPKTKVVDQLTYFGKLEGMKKPEIAKAIDYWFDKFQINEYKNMLAGELSKGNQQKVQLIGTLLHDPDFVILDEPFSGLDPVNATMLSDAISELIQQDKTVILSSHRMEEIERFCENICMMKDGNMIVSGNLQQVKDDYGYKNLAITLEKPSEHAKLQKAKASGRNRNFIIQVKDEEEGLATLNELVTDGVLVKNFSLMEPTLHEIFVERVQ